MILSLPDEMIIEIISHTSGDDFQNLIISCKRLSSLHNRAKKYMTDLYWPNRWNSTNNAVFEILMFNKKRVTYWKPCILNHTIDTKNFHIFEFGNVSEGDTIIDFNSKYKFRIFTIDAAYNKTNELHRIYRNEIPLRYMWFYGFTSFKLYVQFLDIPQNINYYSNKEFFDNILNVKYAMYDSSLWKDIEKEVSKLVEKTKPDIKFFI